MFGKSTVQQHPQTKTDGGKPATLGYPGGHFLPEIRLVATVLVAVLALFLRAAAVFDCFSGATASGSVTAAGSMAATGVSWRASIWAVSAAGAAATLRPQENHLEKDLRMIECWCLQFC